jgi:peptidyl-tRNA hydrolase
MASAAAAAAASAAAAVAAAAPPDDFLVMYVVLRRDLWTELRWPLGPVVAQAAHAATAALWLARDAPATAAYCADGAIDAMRKVTLEVGGEAELRALAAKLEAAGVVHKLWVEQPEGVATALATAPAAKSAVGPLLKRLKLCKGAVR